MHECSVDQHKRWKSKRYRRIFRSDHRRDNRHYNDQAVGDIEVFPPRGQVEHLLGPIPPVEHEFLKDMGAVGRDTQPEHDLKMRHRNFPLSWPNTALSLVTLFY